MVADLKKIGMEVTFKEDDEVASEEETEEEEGLEEGAPIGSQMQL